MQCISQMQWGVNAWIKYYKKALLHLPQSTNSLCGSSALNLIYSFVPVSSKFHSFSIESSHERISFLPFVTIFSSSFKISISFATRLRKKNWGRKDSNSRFFKHSKFQLCKDGTLGSISQNILHLLLENLNHQLFDPRTIKMSSFFEQEFNNHSLVFCNLNLECLKNWPLKDLIFQSFVFK